MAACAAGGAAVSAAKGNTTTTTYDSKGRVTKKGFTNKGSLLYTYTEGSPMYDFAEMQEDLCKLFLILYLERCHLMNSTNSTKATPLSAHG